ncbi:MAG: thymidylate kinase [bacterium]|nr:thymidylate kinase [bacterium]
MRTPRPKGLLIVIDGLDGSGKATQQKLLGAKLKAAGYKVKLIDFPQYYNNFIGAFIGQCLAGEHGQWNKLDPYIASVIYAADRFESSAKIKKWLEQGYIVLSDRYVSANQIYQGGKIIDDQKRQAFLTWLDKLEFGVFKLPRPDIIFFLDVPHKISMKLAQKAQTGSKAYLKGKRDLNETDADLTLKARRNAVKIVKSANNWIPIRCVDRRHRLLPPEDITEKLWLDLRKYLRHP